MHAIWQGLLANFAVVAMVLTAWANIAYEFKRLRRLPRAVVFGLLMGSGSVLAICLSFDTSPGFYSDLRAAPLAMAGLFGGPVSAIFSLLLPIAYRVWLGGAGAVSGLLSMIAVAAVSAAFARYRRTWGLSTLKPIAAAAVITAAGTLAGWLATPAQATAALASVAPVTFMNFVGIALASVAFLRERQRRAMARNNTLYRAVIEALPDCLNVKDTEGRFLIANPATAELMQSGSSDRLIGKTDFDFYLPEVARRFRGDDEAALASDLPKTTIEQFASFADGSHKWLSTLKAPLRDENGEVVGLITHNRDISAAKATQIELDTTRQRLADALENMADGLVVYDSEARIVLRNQQYLDLFPGTADLRQVGASLPEIIRKAIERGEESEPEDKNLDAMLARILNHLKTGGQRLIGMSDGRWIEARTRPTSDGGALTILADVTARKRVEIEMQFQAEHDPLTGVANRAAFNSRLVSALGRARAGVSQVGLLLIDLDHFKQINDTLGHQAGDRLLIEVASRLKSACRGGDLVARLGGDEFAILCEHKVFESGLAPLAQRVVDNVSARFDLEGVTRFPGCSVGVAFAARDATEPAELVERADQALYAAKRNGRRGWMDYSNLASEKHAATA